MANLPCRDQVSLPAGQVDGSRPRNARIRTWAQHSETRKWTAEKNAAYRGLLDQNEERTRRSDRTPTFPVGYQARGLYRKPRNRPKAISSGRQPAALLSAKRSDRPGGSPVRWGQSFDRAGHARAACLLPLVSASLPRAISTWSANQAKVATPTASAQSSRSFFRSVSTSSGCGHRARALRGSGSVRGSGGVQLAV